MSCLLGAFEFFRRRAVVGAIALVGMGFLLAPDVRAQQVPGSQEQKIAPGGNKARVSLRLTEHLRYTIGDRVFFSAGSAQLGAKARQVLNAQALWMKRRPKFGALIIGHADDPGSLEDNLYLASRRAAAVRMRLVEEGVAPERLAIEAAGEDQPIAVCEADICRAQNRRVETSILYTLPVVQSGRLRR